jgi:hypothetical protein
MPHMVCPSQSKHWLVLKHVHPLEAYEDSSSQHGQANIGFSYGACIKFGFIIRKIY